MICISFNRIFKVVLAGEKGSGKRKFLEKFAQAIFTTDTRITIGAEFYTIDLSVDQIGSVRLQVWDFSSEENKRFLLSNYTRNADGILFLFSLTDESTLNSLVNWLPILRSNDLTIPIVVAASKLELKKLRKVQQKDAIKFIRSHDCAGYDEISLDDDKSVNNLLESMCRIMQE